MNHALLVVAAALFIQPAQAVERVVSLNLCTDQFLVLLAPEKIAGVSTLARDPALSFVAARAATLPVVRASAEAVMAVHPDLVLGARFGARTTLDLLERAGLPVTRIDLPTDFPGIRAALHESAALLGVSERAEPLIAAMDATLPTIPHAPKTDALVWQPRGLTSGPGGLMDAVLRQAGLRNAGTGRAIGMEALLRHPPALLVMPENDAGPSLATEMLAHPAVSAIPTRTIPARLTICAGPFTAEAVTRLVR